MPVSYSLRGTLLRIDCVDLYEPEEIVACFDAAMDDPDCPRPAALLLDVTRSRSLADRKTHDVIRVARHLEGYVTRIGGRCAVLAASNVQFGLSRVGAAHVGTSGIEARVFRELGAALQWLDVPAAGH